MHFQKLLLIHIEIIHFSDFAQHILDVEWDWKVHHLNYHLNITSLPHLAIQLTGTSLCHFPVRCTELLVLLLLIVLGSHLAQKVRRERCREELASIIWLSYASKCFQIELMVCRHLESDWSISKWLRCIDFLFLEKKKKIKGVNVIWTPSYTHQSFAFITLQWSQRA